MSDRHPEPGGSVTISTNPPPADLSLMVTPTGIEPVFQP